MKKYIGCILVMTFISCLPKNSKKTSYQQPEAIKGVYSQRSWEFSIPALGNDIGSYEPNASFQLEPLLNSGHGDAHIQCLLKPESKRQNHWFLNFFAYKKERLIFYKNYSLQNCRSLRVQISEQFDFDRIEFKVSWNEGRQNYVMYQGQTQNLKDVLLQRVLLDKKIAGQPLEDTCSQEGFYYGEKCHHQWFSLKVRRSQLCLSNDDSQEGSRLVQKPCNEDAMLFQLRRRQQEGYTLQERSSYRCLTRSDQGWVFEECYVFKDETTSDLARKQLFIVNAIPDGGAQLELLGERKQCVGLSTGVTASGAHIQKVECIKDLGQWFDFL